ncbi:SWI SNF, matrix associated, actin dependent regulator of chromatin, subfamily d, member 1 [Cichlidogyrus casuarinus]|uniref:SWI SNF, matrix associated, actin dependent regulator of chromatin, subfamily d, member 1 n=1 Tax=Cichlidogyrus casuarinus TaxID=1844966 RepID=A0ABD2QMG4_9PLAT
MQPNQVNIPKMMHMPGNRPIHPQNQPPMGNRIGPNAIANSPQAQHLQRRINMNDNRLHLVARPTIQKRKRRLGERILTKTVRQIIPESESYMELLEVEKKLDLVLMRKRLTLQEALKKPYKTKRKLRIMLSTTVKPVINNVDAEGNSTGEASAPSWELKVEGHLLDKPGLTSPMSSEQKYRCKFSSFFKSLVIELDRELYGPDNHLNEWHRTPTTQETDGFQVKRAGDVNVRCTILLQLDHQPPQHKLDPRLARILGLHTGTRSQIFYALWNYIKVHRLQDPHEKDFINCDPYFEQVFGCSRMRFAEIPHRLIALQMTPDPIVINHLIQVEGEDGGTKTACFDIDVEIEDQYKAMVHNYLQNTQSSQELASIDNKISELVEQITSLKTHREFYLEFSKDPQNFISKWLASQSRDLAAINETRPGHPEQERKSDFYQGSWVHEGIMRYFYNRINQRRLELEHAFGLNA